MQSGRRRLCSQEELNRQPLSRIEKREKALNGDVTGVICGPAEAVNSEATAIVKGDASLFPSIMEYQGEMLKRCE